MKKLGFVVVLVIILVSTGYAQPQPFKVDLSQMTIIPEKGDLVDFENAYPGTRNREPFASQWRWAVATLGELPEDITSYRRVTIKVRFFDADGVELTGENSMVQVGMFYDMSGRNARGELHIDGNRNLILKEANAGGSWGDVSKDRGVRVRMRQPPAGMWIQAADSKVKFIEITEVVFHNGDYESN